MRPGIAITIAGAAVACTGVNAWADTSAWSGADTDEVRALVAEMLADAESRSSLLQGGGTAGHDGQFFLASSDGNFRLNIGGQVQFRYVLNFNDDVDADGDGDPDSDDFVPGFEARRTKLTFDGHIFSPDLFYKVQGAFARSSTETTFTDSNGDTATVGDTGGEFELEYAYVGYNLDNGWKVWWGQDKLPWLREELVSSKYQLAADRSLTNELFNQGYSKGVWLGYQADSWNFTGAFSNGFNSANTGFDESPSDWAFTARAEFKFSGQWSQFDDFNSFKGSENAMMLGIAGNYQEGASDDSVNPVTPEIYGGTIDFTVNGDGWNVFTYHVYQDQSDAGGVAGDDFSDWGFVLQGGFFVNEDWELFGRIDGIFGDSERSGDDLWTLTVGAIYFIHGNAAKFTADVLWLFDGISNTGITEISDGEEGVGVLAGTEDGQIALRFQFQVLF